MEEQEEFEKFMIELKDENKFQLKPISELFHKVGLIIWFY